MVKGKGRKPRKAATKKPTEEEIQGWIAFLDSELLRMDEGMRDLLDYGNRHRRSKSHTTHIWDDELDDEDKQPIGAAA